MLTAYQKIEVAKLGCPKCGGEIKYPPSPLGGVSERCPAGDPFSKGEYKGRYLCSDCWIIIYSEHPEQLADQVTVAYCTREAERIKTERAAKAQEVLYQEGGSRAVLTARGTLLLHLEATPGHLATEFDPDRFALLLRALKEVDTKNIQGYSLSTLRDNI